jgi:excisionase family DNA binding protein
MEKLLTAEEVASLTGLEVHAVYRYAREGILPSIRIGTKVRFPESALQRWVNAQLPEEKGGASHLSKSTPCPYQERGADGDVEELIWSGVLIETDESYDMPDHRWQANQLLEQIAEAIKDSRWYQNNSPLDYIKACGHITSFDVVKLVPENLYRCRMTAVFKNSPWAAQSFAESTRIAVERCLIEIARHYDWTVD